jgi:hypothetical protein
MTRHKQTWWSLTAAVGLIATSAAPARATIPAADDGAALLRSDNEARRLDASPHASVVRLLWQGSARVRGKLALAIPLWGAPARAGLFVHLLPLIELSNSEEFGSLLPAQYWRGRVALEGGWRTRLRLAGLPAVLALSLELMHESDHRTEFGGGCYPGANSEDVLYVDDVALRGQLTSSVGSWTFSGALAPRFHWLSCTRQDRDCNTAAAGGPGFEPGVSLIVSWQALPKRLPGLRPYTALELSWLVGNSYLLTERRLAWRLGAAYRGELVLWQLFFSLRGGNGLGLERGEERLRLGLGLAFSVW